MNKKFVIGQEEVVDVEELQAMTPTELREVRDKCIEKVHTGVHNMDIMILAGYVQAQIRYLEEEQGASA